LKAWDISFACLILSSSLRSGREMPPNLVGREEIWKDGCVLEEFHIKLLMKVCIDFVNPLGGGHRVA